MDQQTRQKLLRLYNEGGLYMARRIREEFPEAIFDEKLVISSFRMKLDPGIIYNQDGERLMTAAHSTMNGAGRMLLSGKFSWRVHNNVDGTQLLIAERKSDGESHF